MRAAEAEAKLVDAKAALLALELRLELFAVGERPLTGVFGVGKERSSSSSWRCTNGAIA